MKEIVRTAYYREKKSKSEIARQLGMSRKTVRKLLNMAGDEIPRYHLKQAKERPVIGPFKSVIDQWLEADENAPVKQRHSAQRVYERLRAEYGFTGSERTVRGYVSFARKKCPEVYLPLAFSAGEMAQVDWGEVKAVIGGKLQVLQLFAMVLNASGALYFEAFWHQNQESFFEGHQNAFAFLGGVARTLTYDNLKSAVTKVLKGRNRVENERFVCFRSAYLFESRFCNPAKGNEKGRIENMIKYGQRNYFTPVPAFETLEALNVFLAAQCRAYQEKRQAREEQTVGERFALEKPHLLPLPVHLPQCCRILPVKADKSALVQFETNRYSVPSVYAYRMLWLKAFVGHIEISDAERVIATHLRLSGRFQEAILFAHYRKVLERKPGARDHFRATQDKLAAPEVSPPTTPLRAVQVQPPNLQQYSLLLKDYAP